MKKTKLIALTMVVAIMMMGAGYAIWSDQVFLTTTVRTGDFDMAITSLIPRTGADQTDKNEPHDWHQYDWTDIGVVEQVNDNQAIVEFKDLYPGGTVQVDMTMFNNGDIPAKLASITVEPISGNLDLYNLLRARTSWKVDINGDGTIEPMGQYKWGHVEWDRETWRTIPGALNALVTNLDFYNIVIEPKGCLQLGDATEEGCINFKLDPSAGNEFQNQSVKFKITFNWEQWASDPTANPYNFGAPFANNPGTGLPGYGGDGDLQ